MDRNETVLAAALRSGFEFPHGCRVGGCGMCKCKLLTGRVTELTETAYLLSAEELGRCFEGAAWALASTSTVSSWRRSR